MNKMSNRRVPILPIVIGLAVLAWAGPAFAYIDPGTGSAILQGILAALAAIALTAKLYWHRLLKFLGLRKDSRTSDDQSPSSPRED